MTRKILVPLRRSDLVADFLPYIEDIARPGMQVVFLVQVGLSGFDELTDQSLALHTGIRSALMPGRRTRRSTWEDHAHRARDKVLSVCNTLRERDVEIRVNVYAGSLRRAVRDFTRDGDVRVIMTHPRIGNRVIKLLKKLLPLPSYFEPAALPPVLFVNPGKNK